MHRKLYKNVPPLKVCEWSVEQGGGGYIAFEEYIDVPGLESADIRIEFSRVSTLDEVERIAKILKDAGFVFVVSK